MEVPSAWPMCLCVQHGLGGYPVGMYEGRYVGKIFIAFLLLS